MNLEFKQKLVDQYPKLFMQTNVERSSMRYGVSTGDGWYDIINDACSKLVEYPVEFSQVKEKFGELRMYFTYTDPNMTPEQLTAIQEIVDEACEKSHRTCDVCGAEGKIRTVHNWLAARCDKHAE